MQFRSAVAGATLLGISAALLPANAQEIWLGPRLPRAPWIHVDGAADWLQLFASRDGWRQSSQKISVLKVTPGYIVDASDTALADLAAGLARFGIVLGLEIQAVATQKSDNCGGSEGYDDPAYIARAIASLERAHLTPKYVAFDEPFWFGHYADGPTECHFSVSETARRTVQIAKLFTSAFPAVVLGDIETPAPLLLQHDWRDNYHAFKQEVEAGVGRKLAFLQLDIDWRNNSAQKQVSTFARMAKTEDMKLGLIYNGDGADPDDQTWTARARDAFTLTESAYGIIPDQAVLQSWNSHPARLLPETSPTSHLWTVAQYILPRSRLVATEQNGQLHGQLLNAAGKGIADARVTLDTMGTPVSQVPPIRTAAGIVPKGAASAVFGMRLNRECFCQGDNNVVVGEFKYSEDHGGALTQTFDYGKTAARQPVPSPDGADVQTRTVGGTQLTHIVVPSEKTFGFNSPVFPVTQGANFTFSVTAASVDGKGMFGALAIIWLDAKGKGFQRTNVMLSHDSRSTVAITTDSEGRFIAPLTIDPDGKPAPVRLHFDGSNDMRGAYLELP